MCGWGEGRGLLFFVCFLVSLFCFCCCCCCCCCLFCLFVCLWEGVVVVVVVGWLAGFLFVYCCCCCCCGLLFLVPL